MRRFTALHIPVLSFYSKHLYSDVALNWKGVNFLYLFLLLAICWVPVTIILERTFSQYVKTDLPPIIQQVPKITVTNGEVSVSEPQPYYIKNPKNDKNIVIIDTTGQITSLEKTGAWILVMKNSVMVKENQLQTRVISLADVKNLEITGEKIMSWAQAFKKIIIVALYPFLVLGSFIFRIIQVLIYAAIGLLFASWCHVKLDYSALIRLSVVAITPVIIINTFLISSGRYLPLAGLIYFVLAMAYLFLGVKSTADESVSREITEPPENESGEAF